MSGRTIGNLILMTLICVVVFIVFMAVRPTKASAQNLSGPLAFMSTRPRVDQTGKSAAVEENMMSTTRTHFTLVCLRGLPRGATDWFNHVKRSYRERRAHRILV